jgi:hypothetical protein
MSEIIARENITEGIPILKILKHARLAQVSEKSMQKTLKKD